MILEIVAIIVVSLVFLVGLILAALGLPGAFVVFAGAVLYNLITWSWTLSFEMLGILLGLAILAEVIEFVFGLLGAKVFKMSHWTTFGFIAGLIIGAIVGVPIPIIGSVVGMLVGGFLGAFIVSYIEKQNLKKSLKAGFGAFVTGIGSIMLKLVIVVIMIVIFFVTVLS
ncbi:DUF456 domain-containing protein [Candidatus Woesearchaeota archaeon]|nr:DUF456 domain-containing protein [Candidatus Woesearchaeota archaeon]MBW3005892.1 DUF456 domain-containing protein [Candidatus Woesearchaeota archaeon]